MIIRRSLTSDEGDRLRLRAELAEQIEFAVRKFDEDKVKRGEGGRFAKKAVPKKKLSEKELKALTLKEEKAHRSAVKDWEARKGKWVTDQQKILDNLIAEREALVKELQKYGRSNPAPPEMRDERLRLEAEIDKGSNKASGAYFPESKPSVPPRVRVKWKADTKAKLEENSESKSDSKKNSKTCNKYPALIQGAKQKIKSADSPEAKEKARKHLAKIAKASSKDC